MKTPINILLIFSVIILVSLHLNATITFFSGNKTKSKSNNTETVINSANAENSNENIFDLEEEGYIDDIPFDTDCISDQCIFNRAMAEEFNFEPEEYIDDIQIEI